MEVTTITAAAIQLHLHPNASALMQVVPLTIIPAHPAVLPLKINLLLETRLQKKPQPRKFPPAGRRTITAGGTAFPQTATMLTA